jgi:hypothetical protein
MQGKLGSWLPPRKLIRFVLTVETVCHFATTEAVSYSNHGTRWTLVCNRKRHSILPFVVFKKGRVLARFFWSRFVWDLAPRKEPAFQAKKISIVISWSRSYPWNSNKYMNACIELALSGKAAENQRWKKDRWFSVSATGGTVVSQHFLWTVKKIFVNISSKS